VAYHNKKAKKYTSMPINGNTPRPPNSVSVLAGITGRQVLHKTLLALVAMSLWKKAKFFFLFLPVMGCVIFVTSSSSHGFQTTA